MPDTTSVYVALYLRPGLPTYMHSVHALSNVFFNLLLLDFANESTGKKKSCYGVIHNLHRQRIGREGFSKCLHKYVSFNK